MKQPLYWLGRALQLSGLLGLPSAIWTGSMEHNERNSIFIFLACVGLFYAGYFLTRLRVKL